MKPASGKEKGDQGNFITEGSLIKALLIVAMPIILSNALQSVLEIVDMYFIGHLGNTSIAGGSVSMSIIMVLMTVFIGLMTATAAFISRAYGSKNFDRIPVILAHSLLMAAIVSGVIAVIGMFWSEDILLILSKDAAVAAEGAKFLSPLLEGIFTIVLLMIIVTAFQASGDSKTPMYVMVAINIVNIILNPTLINGLFGLPAFGIAGSAYATILSRAFGILVFAGLIYLLPSYKSNPVRLPVHFKFEPKLLTDVVFVAIPSALQMGVRSTSFMLMMWIIAFYGEATIAAYGVCIRLDMLGLIIVMGFGTAIAIMVGQNLGAKKPDRAKDAVKYAVALAVGFICTVAALYFVNAADILVIFGLGGEALDVGISFMHVIPLSYWVIAIAMTLGFAMNGAGATRPGMYSAIIGMLIIQCSTSYYLMINGFSINFIWYAVVLGAISMCTTNYLFFRHGGWLKKKLDIGGES
ncbi:MAG: MATE family efflux transporter [Methanomicrobium sp.]|nr:MATE family efflux transporter [Methanomicrobium sp.]